MKLWREIGGREEVGAQDKYLVIKLKQSNWLYILSFEGFGYATPIPKKEHKEAKIFHLKNWPVRIPWHIEYEWDDPEKCPCH